jgi:uncharacterized cupin superfamily protein
MTVQASDAETQVKVFTRAESENVPSARSTATVLTTLRSSDRKFETGFWQVGPEHEEYLDAGYENYEFCYILTGSVTLTAANGTVHKIGSGDAVSIPKGWKGRWDSEGYTKLWVIYYADR